MQVKDTSQDVINALPICPDNGTTSCPQAEQFRRIDLSSFTQKINYEHRSHHHVNFFDKTGSYMRYISQFHMRNETNRAFILMDESDHCHRYNLTKDNNYLLSYRTHTYHMESGLYLKTSLLSRLATPQ